MPTPFIIVADRGRLRMFASEKVNGRQRLRSLADARLVEPHLKASEKYSDQAGARSNNGDGLDFKGSDENMRLGIEEDKRIFEQVGHRINALLHEHAAERWMFAAPAEINGSILNFVEKPLVAKLQRNLQRDLVNVEPADLPSHFDL